MLRGDLSLAEYLPTVEHLEFAHRGVYVTVAAANHLLGLAGTLRRAVFDLVGRRQRASTGTFLGHAERDRDLEHVLAAVGRSHLAGAGVQPAVGTARGTGHPPAGLTAVASALAVLPARTDHSLAAGDQLHLAGRVVHVAVRGANRTILGGTTKKRGNPISQRLLPHGNLR